MQIAIVIDAPFNETPGDGGREWQWRRTALSKLVELLASQIRMGVNAGRFSDDATGATLHFKIEPTPPPAAAEGEAA